MKYRLLLLIAFCSFLFCMARVRAQNVPGHPVISGTVTDLSGAVVTGARVEIRNVASGETRTVESDGSGRYAFRDLPDGQYRITVEALGFQRLVRDGIVLKSERETIANLDLAVASRQDTVTVVERNDYGVPDLANVSKLNAPIEQIPFAVQVVPSAVIQDQLAQRLPDITRNVSGVQTNFGYGALYEAFALRGFETNVTLRNGERVSGGIGRRSVDVANVEDVEVLKGPSAMIYGRLEPGGMINVVTKKPLETSRYSAQQEFGSFNLFRTTLDATGPIAGNRNLLYRGIFSFFDADQFIVHAPHGRTIFVAPSISWRPTGKLVLNANVEYRNMDPQIANGIPAIGNRPADVPITLYLGGDVGDRANVRRNLLEVNGSYQLNAAWSMLGSVAVTFDDIDFEQFFGGSLDESPY